MNSDCPFCGKPDQDNVCQRCGTSFGMARPIAKEPAMYHGCRHPANIIDDARDELIRNNFSPIDTRGRTVMGYE